MESRYRHTHGFIKNIFENLESKETQGKLGHILLKDFAEFINLEPETFTRHLNILEDIKLIKRDVQGQSVLITIHPDFAFRQDYQNKYDKYYGSVIRYQFSQHQRTKSNKGRKTKRANKNRSFLGNIITSTLLI